MATTRLGVSGFARQPYGSFATKAAPLITRHRGAHAMAAERFVTAHTLFANKSFVEMTYVGPMGIGRLFDAALKSAVTDVKNPGPFSVLGVSMTTKQQMVTVSKPPPLGPLRERKTLTPPGTRVNVRQRHKTR